MGSPPLCLFSAFPTSLHAGALKIRRLPKNPVLASTVAAMRANIYLGHGNQKYRTALFWFFLFTFCTLLSVRAEAVELLDGQVPEDVRGPREPKVLYLLDLLGDQREVHRERLRGQVRVHLGPASAHGTAEAGGAQGYSTHRGVPPHRKQDRLRRLGPRSDHQPVGARRCPHRTIPRSCSRVYPGCTREWVSTASNPSNVGNNTQRYSIVLNGTLRLQQECTGMCNGVLYASAIARVVACRRGAFSMLGAMMHMYVMHHGVILRKK